MTDRATNGPNEQPINRQTYMEAHREVTLPKMLSLFFMFSAVLNLAMSDGHEDSQGGYTLNNV